MLTFNTRWEKLDLIHDMFSTPSVSRIANRVVVNRYDAIGQTFVLVLKRDNTTVVLPVQVGVPTSTLPLDERAYFLLRNKKHGITFAEISMEMAQEYIAKQPELDEADIAASVEKVLNNSFMSDALPSINRRDPDNWMYFMQVFRNQGNDVMGFYMALAITKFQGYINAQSKAV
ncbi:MAG: hypothetical protein P8I03_06945 [Thalassotalea sp.]|nr:hypothetical protein [Thalassotalea sp.]